ncbi:unnamed protein product [marine sediment metagenome]|uniref:DNA (cytosine-5-)-methyltransferase n=1 Tax=marine sediment metagenome TaxID=412755 RepID=X1W0I1_9ZZZZ
MNIVDLFSGYGGASEAFVDAGDLVRRYEIDYSVCEIVPHSVQADLGGFDPGTHIRRTFDHLRKSEF